MGGPSGLSELSVISWVSAVEGCPLRVPLYTVLSDLGLNWLQQNLIIDLGSASVNNVIVPGLTNT